MPALAPEMHVAQPFIFFKLTSNKTVTLNNYPGFTVTFPAGMHFESLPVKIGFYSQAVGWKHIGDMTLAGSTATFTPTNSGPIILNAGQDNYAITYACTGPTTIPLAGPGTAMSIPPVGGFSGDFSVASNNAPSGTTVTMTSYDSEPAGAPVPEEVHRGGFQRMVLTPKAFLWVKFSFSNAISFDAFPISSWTLAPGTPTSGTRFFLETFDAVTDKLLAIEVASSVSGSTVSFPSLDETFKVSSGHPYWWVLVSSSTTPSQDLFVSSNAINTIFQFAPGANGNVSPVNTITNVGGSTAVSSVAGLAVDGSGFVYVTNNSLVGPYPPTTPGDVWVFAPGATGNATPVRIISGSNTGVIGYSSDTKLDPAGNLYINNTYSISVFPPGASGNASPSRVIAGSNTGLGLLNNPPSIPPTGPGSGGIAVGPDGTIYASVGAAVPPAILEFAPGAGGNVAPVRTISGPATGLVGFGILTTDSAGNIYTVNFISSSDQEVYEFAAGASGNVAPIRKIGPLGTVAGGPITVDLSGQIYVGDEGDGKILVFAAGASGNATPIRIISGPKTGIVNPNQLWVRLF
ncbi:MAG: hypothetical protein JOZ91_11650 [Candidatus Eremiobacteraeota bacterium]|nr:hypothetical protein [Candidatus Eremiobacteraeota bacterium]